jgi:hypothetical protein
MDLSDEEEERRGGGTEFTVPVEVHGSVVGFFGRAGTYLDALGVYIRTY